MSTTMSRQAKRRHGALLGAVATGMAGIGLASPVQAESVPAAVDTATLAGFLPPADPGLEFVDAGSAMPPDFIRQSMPDVLGRQWASVVRTYWSYPIPGLGALPPESGLAAVPENILHHIETALIADPGGAFQVGFTAAGNSLIASVTGISTYLPYLGYLVSIPGGLANILTDWAPGVPPVYQVSIDYFKVGELQPAVADAARETFGPVRATVGEAVHSVTDPVRATVGGALRGIFGPVRSTVRTAIDQGLDSVKNTLSSSTGSECRLAYAEEVTLFPVDPATLPPDQPPSAPWPPAMEAGFDCAGVMNRRMYVDVGAGFAGAGDGVMPIWYDPFTGQWADYVGIGITSVLSPTIAAGPTESLVVTIDSVKSRDDLHRLAQSIDYQGLCWAVHPDGEGCPQPVIPAEPGIGPKVPGAAR